ncbi:MAG TPA: 4Fe-4S dicluster domain-containing protein [Dehalococcoidia bacterium]|nr:4Fe-4S dicluster domain-containing protein [Dehalococcoidia bacterium]
MIGVLKGLARTWATHWRKPVTVEYPNERLPLQPRYMGFPALIWDKGVDEPFCTGCQVCMRYCPTECIFVTMKDNPKQAAGESKRRKIVDEFTLDISRCISCAICVEVCNFNAIEMTHLHEDAGYYPDLVADLPTLLKRDEDHRAHRGQPANRETRNDL